MSCQESELGPNQCSRTLYVAETLAVCVPEVLQRVTSNAAQEESLTPWLTGAGSRRLEGTNISHEDAEGMAYVGVRVEPPVRASGPARRGPLCKGNWVRCCGKVRSGTAEDRTVNGA